MGLRPATETELAADFGGEMVAGTPLPQGDAGEAPEEAPALDSGLEEVSWLPADDTAAAEHVDDAPRRSGWIIPIAGFLLSLAWIASMLWFALPEFPMRATALAQFVATLCMPVVLIAVLCLLTLRTSRAEATRFGATARAMRAEASALEATVAVLADRIEDNRRALAEQTRQLIELGDAASDRMRALEADMTAESRVLETICNSLRQTATEAERSLTTVFDSLPKAHAETQGLTSALNTAGLAASERAGELAGRLATLAERARNADDIASGAAARLAAHIDRMESATNAATSRLDSAAENMGSSVESVLDKAAEAIDSARRSVEAQGEAVVAMVSASQASLDQTGRDQHEALQQRLASVEEAIGRIGGMLSGEQSRLDTLFASVSVGIDAVSGQFGRLHDEGMTRSQSLAASISALSESANALSETMRVGETNTQSLISTAENLLVALDASAREIDETLPEALGRLEQAIDRSRSMVGKAKPELLALVTAAESTHDAVDAVARLVVQEREKLQNITASLTQALDVGQDKAQTMHGVVDQAIAKTRKFAEDSAPQLVEALQRIRGTASHAASQAREVLLSLVPDAMGEIEAASDKAIRAAFDRALPQPLAELNAIAESAVSAAAGASEKLGQQLMTIAETTATLEARIDAERADREAHNQENLGRRMSLLVEALNSASIDIAKVLAPEITDSAWAAYLKGDRGVFTRRAVRLLDHGDAREIARLHDTDEAFREHVNRYIHDFEGLLRQILSMRDGSALAITLLSSDMGKLYVALAQAIERLRT